MALKIRKPRKVRETHGETIGYKWTPEYRAWVNMITRCHNPRSTRYECWGGRGIRVFEEWRNSFASFLSHIGRRPSFKHSVDRFPNPDGNYEPGNVRWATPEQQTRNYRGNLMLAAFGKTMPMVEWAAERGIKYQVLQWRIAAGWNVERALSTPKLSQSQVARAASSARWGNHAS